MDPQHLTGEPSHDRLANDLAAILAVDVVDLRAGRASKRSSSLTVGGAGLMALSGVLAVLVVGVVVARWSAPANSPAGALESELALGPGLAMQAQIDPPAAEPPLGLRGSQTAAPPSPSRGEVVRSLADSKPRLASRTRPRDGTKRARTGAMERRSEMAVGPDMTARGEASAPSAFEVARQDGPPAAPALVGAGASVPMTETSDDRPRLDREFIRTRRLEIIDEVRLLRQK